MTRGKTGGHPGKRPEKRLRVIPEPEEGTRSVLVPTDDVVGPVINGPGGRGTTDQVCGSCGRVLIAGIAPSQVMEMVIRCPDCGSYNDTGGAPHLN